MKIKKVIFILLFCLTNSAVFGQTIGFNYQALILSNEVIQIPGTDVTKPNAPLASEEIILRFTISNDVVIEYIEEQKIFTDEFGMVSLIVGEGTPKMAVFSDIVWDGKPKYLNVELKIIDKDKEFELIDSQKILHIPGAGGSGYGNIKIVNSIDEIKQPYKKGDLVWITSYGENNNTTLLIWNDVNWIPVNQDYDTKNELGLVVVPDKSARTSVNPNPKEGDVVWNQRCKCIQVYDDNDWISITTKAGNGLTLNNDGTVKLGGTLTEPTVLDTDNINTLSIKGLQNSSNLKNNIIVIDENTGVLKQTPIESINLNVQHKELIIFAIDGQLEFTTPLKITNSSKINVFRNGINIGFEVVDSNTIKIEPEAICYKDDKIRIVQVY